VKSASMRGRIPKSHIHGILLRCIELWNFKYSDIYVTNIINTEFMDILNEPIRKADVHSLLCGFPYLLYVGDDIDLHIIENYCKENIKGLFTIKPHAIAFRLEGRWTKVFCENRFDAIKFNLEFGCQHNKNNNLRY